MSLYNYSHSLRRHTLFRTFDAQQLTTIRTMLLCHYYELCFKFSYGHMRRRFMCLCLFEHTIKVHRMPLYVWACAVQCECVVCRVCVCASYRKTCAILIPSGFSSFCLSPISIRFKFVRLRFYYISYAFHFGNFNALQRTCKLLN